MAEPVNVTNDTFQEEVLSSKVPVLVDFWAEWCGPCKMIAPSIKDLANEYEGRAKIAKLDVDSNQATAQQFGVRSIPSLLVFKDGEVVDTIIGAVSKERIKESLNASL